MRLPNTGTFTTFMLVAAALLPEGPSVAGPCSDWEDPPPISRASRLLGPAVIEQIQEELYNRGYYDGPIDGIWGPRTEEAFLSFQQVRGFQRVGKLTRRTLASLGIRGTETGLAACRRE